MAETEPGNHTFWGESPARRTARGRGAGVGHVVPEPVSSPGRRTTTQGDPPLVLNGRKRLVRALTGLALVASVGLVPSSRAGRARHRATSSARVDDLYHEAEAAQERYHDAKLELDELASGPRRPSRPTRSARTSVSSRSRTQVRDSVIRQYQGENLSAVGQVFVSDDAERLPRPAVDDDVLQRPADPAVLRVLARGQGARHPPGRDREPRRRHRRGREAARRREGRRRRQARRGQGPARRARGRGAGAARGPAGLAQRRRARPCRRLGLGQRGRGRVTTRWPRSATPTSTARPAPTPSTAPV